MFYKFLISHCILKNLSFHGDWMGAHRHVSTSWEKVKEIQRGEENENERLY